MGIEQDGPKGFQVVEGDPKATGAAAGPLPPISFGTFVLSLSTSALMHMGATPVPGEEEPLEPNLPLARQTIKILAMLSEKTAGNLDEDERHLLDGVLHDLRMRLVELRKGES